MWFELIAKRSRLRSNKKLEAAVFKMRSMKASELLRMKSLEKVSEHRNREEVCGVLIERTMEE